MAWQKVEVQFWTLKLSSCDGHLKVHVLYLNNYAIFWNSGFAEVKQGTHEKEIFGKKLLIGPIMDTKLSFLLKYIKTKTHFFQNSTQFSIGLTRLLLGLWMILPDKFE